MYRMFYGCNNLKLLDIDNFNDSSITNMEYVFCNCQYLTAEITIKGDALSYGGMFVGAAKQAGTVITVNYTAETSDLVDAMIATKSANSNVVKGRLVE